MQPHRSDDSNKPRPLEIFSDLISDVVPQIEAVLMAHLKGFTTSILSTLLSFCYARNAFWWNGCSAYRALNPRAMKSCGNLVSGMSAANECRLCSLLSVSRFTLTLVTKLKAGDWIMREGFRRSRGGIPQRILSATPAQRSDWVKLELARATGRSVTGSFSCSDKRSFLALPADQVDERRLQIKEECGNLSHKMGAMIKLSKESNVQREFVKENDEPTTSDDANRNVFVDREVLSKPKATGDVVRFDETQLPH